MADNLHSQLVVWGKILLPLAALALLSTLFLFSRAANDTSAIPFAEIDALARDQRITAPQFSGVTTEGAILQISAESAQPQDGDLETLVITAPRLALDAPDGTTLRIVAGEGALDGSSQEARLTGLARLETSSGFLMETSGMIAALDTGEVNSIGPLEIRTPFGAASAGHVRIHVAKDGTGQQMHFTNGVKLIYTPPSDPKDE